MSQVSQIASDAFIYFYPIVENLKTLFGDCAWPHTSSYDNGPNIFTHWNQLMDWTFMDVVTPNNDTVYSQAWLDLEASPIVLALPDVPLNADGSKRYYSMQLVDGYTFNVKTISPRVTESFSATSYLIVGPNYTGSIPQEFDSEHTVHSLSRFLFALGRTQLYSEDDIENVKKIQQGYTVTPLQGVSIQARARARTRTAQSSLPIFPYVDKDELAKHSPEAQIFFTYANFIINYLHIEDFEKPLYDRFKLIDVGPGMSFVGQNMSQEKYKAIQDGITDGSDKIDRPQDFGIGGSNNGWTYIVDPPIFGTPERMKGRYINRATAARSGLYGNDVEEAYYLPCTNDISGAVLDSANNYTLTFTAGSLPPTKDGGFWSITMYRLPEGLFVHSPIDRYSIGDRTEGLYYDSTGALTIYIQKKQPDTAEKVKNWLPSPDPEFAGYESGRFRLYCRVYWPTDEALLSVPPYTPPGVVKTSAASSR